MRNFKFLLPVALLVIVAPIVVNTIARGDAADTAPAATANAIAATPPNNLTGWTIPDAAAPGDPSQAAKIARGRYLTVAGDCLPCHSVEGEPAFSGGRAMGSPVGAVFTPNITPDKTYGIGNYTDKQFWNVIHNGIAPGSSYLIFPKYLYPSMPYDAYSKLSYDDVMAIKAYLATVPPAAIPSRPTQIPFPLNTRAALLGWRMLFFHPQPVQYDQSWSASVRNGAFLVQALGHCSDCHTPRNLLMGSETDRFLAGGHILAQSWYAPNISSSKQDGVGAWSSDQLVDYLHNGGSLGAGAPYGPMQETVYDSLSRLPVSDIKDIAAYLQTGTGAQQAASFPDAGANSTSAGSAIYADNCARCHGGNGEGVANNFPNLAGNQAVYSGPSNDIISMVLGGYLPWHAAQSTMPAFRDTLSDDQIAAVSNYVRTAWGNKGTADATGALVGSLRGTAESNTVLDTGTTQVSIGSAGQSQTFDDIAGTFELDGDRLNCRIDARFMSTGNPSQTVALAGSCDEQGGKLRGLVTVNGQTTPVTLNLTDDKSGAALEAVDIAGPIGNGAFLHTHIALVTQND